ncbi:MAG: PRC-barrel domain-containing protein [Clostridiales bacterium]
MKKISDIIGLSIISIDKGICVGKIRDIIINAREGSVDFIILESDSHSMVSRIVSSSDVIGLGEYAMTLQSEDVIKNIEEIPEALDLLHRDIKVTKTRVLTKKGRLIGEIGGVFIDDSNEEITISGLEFIKDIAKKTVKIIPRNSILTFGKELIVVEENIEELLLDDSNQLDEQNKNNSNELKNSYIEKINKVVDEDKNDDEIDNEELVEIINMKNINKSLNEENLKSGNKSENFDKNQKDNDNIAGLFEEKQREYLLGRKVSKNIIDKEGKVIITKGTQIDNDVIDVVKGRGKLVELVMNNNV